MSGIAQLVRKLLRVCNLPLYSIKKLIGLHTIDFPNVAARQLNFTLFMCQGLHLVLRVKMGRLVFPTRTLPQLVKPILVCSHLAENK
jgi:hypothetical protein